MKVPCGAETESASPRVAGVAEPLADAPSDEAAYDDVGPPVARLDDRVRPLALRRSARDAHNDVLARPVLPAPPVSEPEAIRVKAEACHVLERAVHRAALVEVLAQARDAPAADAPASEGPAQVIHAAGACIDGLKNVVLCCAHTHSQTVTARDVVCSRRSPSRPLSSKRAICHSETGTPSSSSRIALGRSGQRFEVRTAQILWLASSSRWSEL